MTSTTRRRRLRRGVIILPSAFTLGNLFLGIWAIVAASRGEFAMAGWLILLAGVADMLDGRVARFTRTGSEFGEELDSLVDGVSFGVAPALIMYFLYFQDAAGWGWTVCFLFVAGVLVRLARFNLEQPGGAKRAFHGLPSPAAGISLATFYPFTQTAFFQANLTELPWNSLIAGMMVVLAVLMVSHVLYAVVPRFEVRTLRGMLTVSAALIAVVAALFVPALFFFPAMVVYIVYGLGRSAVLGFLDRLPERDPLLDEDDDDEDGDGAREVDYEEIRPAARRRRRVFGSKTRQMK